MAGSIRRFFENILAEVAAQGFFKWFATVTGLTVFAGIWEWISGRSPLEIVGLLALAAASVLFFFERLSAWKARRRTHTISFSPSTSAGEQEEEEEGDCVRPTRGAYARYLAVPHEAEFTPLSARIEQNRLGDANPLLSITFSALNAHFDTVQVVGVQGGYAMSGQEFAGHVDLRGGNNGITHGDRTSFTIRQWISGPDVGRMRTQMETNHVVLQVVGLDIRCEAIDPTTATKTRDFRFALPSTIQFAKKHGWAVYHFQER
ncbi:MAG: hypothetical protein HOB82_03505 [Alphaproteobacteria bacterium]|jgi:hypothetical protein|nr:hypothetical protein [Alphaproteobacteria bacterium]MBT5860344.1 hypothetical protein [Alphaproteobacteria bacterium]